jgi:hypothetical protein
MNGFEDGKMQPNNSLQTTADGAFNLTIESLVFKCRSSAVFEVGRWVEGGTHL